MKKIKKLLCILSIGWISITSAIAQEPSDFGTTGETNNDPDDSDVPIDNYLFILLIAGIGYGYYKKGLPLKQP
ncbi:hypothetical protein [Flavobacterium sp.]|jgi:hypothetical protein|uniref:hypothetical protein n=1 Tax=Flavobacterium sp. TaxID=239 RepID=UPI0037BF077E